MFSTCTSVATSSFPVWAIVVIVIGGVLLIVVVFVAIVCLSRITDISHNHMWIVQYSIYD